MAIGRGTLGRALVVAAVAMAAHPAMAGAAPDDVYSCAFRNVLGAPTDGTALPSGIDSGSGGFGMRSDSSAALPTTVACARADADAPEDGWLEQPASTAALYFTGSYEARLGCLPVDLRGTLSLFGAAIEDYLELEVEMRVVETGGTIAVLDGRDGDSEGGTGQGVVTMRPYFEHSVLDYQCHLPNWPNDQFSVDGAFTVSVG